MSDDFHLLPDPDQGDPSIDADVAFIAAYLAGELSPMQRAAVEHRLTTDAAFRAAVEPIIAGWTLPRPFRSAPIGGTRGDTAELTPSEIEAGWQRHLAGPSSHQPFAPSPRPVDAGSVGRPNWRSTMTRIAAVIAVVMLPLFGAAQIVHYLADHEGAPGNGVSQQITSALNPSAVPASRSGSRDQGVKVNPIADVPETGSLALKPLSARNGPRPLGAVIGVSTPLVGEPEKVRQLPDGRLLVNDPIRRQLFVLDRALSHSTVVIDSTDGPPKGFWTSMFGFRGDSILFGDTPARAFRVLDPNLKFIRSMPAPPGLPLFPRRDGSERWVPGFGILYESFRPEGDVCASPAAPEAACTGLLLSMNPDSHAVDTVTTYYWPNYASELGGTTDRWAVMSDGSVAFLNGREYRIEWLNPDRTRTVGPPIPNEGKRLSDQERSRLADSINADHASHFQRDLANWKLDSADVADGRPWTPRLKVESFGIAVPAGAPAPVFGRPSQFKIGTGFVSDSTGKGVFRPVERKPIKASELPDHIPPADRALHALLADMDNRLWIRWGAWITSADQPATYDIVNRSGVLVDRVQLPAGRTVIGFGRGGIVYLLAKGASTYTIEKVQFK